MLSTLRRRFIISHALPMFIVIPVIGLVLIYAIESLVLLDSISKDLTAQAVLVSDMASESPAIWQDGAQSQAFVNRIGDRLTADVTLLTIEGRMIASNELEDGGTRDAPMDQSSKDTIVARQTIVRIVYSMQSEAGVADVMAPVVSEDQSVKGIVRLTQRLDGVADRFLRLRYLVIGVVALGLMFSVILGYVLAVNLERPLKAVAQGALALSEGQPLQQLPERGAREVRSLARAFNTLAARLNASEESRRQLLANIVHELGRPLGALRSASQALIGGAADDVPLRRELLTGIDDQLRRLQRLVDDLVQFYGHAAGTLKLERNPLALSEWLPYVLAPWRESAQDKGLQWRTELPDNLPVISADPDRLAQALENLLSNAIKYTLEGGTVTIEAGWSEDAAFIAVRDTGPGIPLDAQQHIFDPFYRGQAGTRFPQGMGLGLTIARDLVVAHGGRLEVDSTPGQGSRFSIILPTPTPIPPAPTPTPNPDPTP